MTTFKDRDVKLNGKSEVYFNLHKRVFSMKQGGLVVLHAPVILLSNAIFKVSEAGRQRVLKERRKNVHARVIGDFLESVDKILIGDEEGYREAYYNPYKTSSFIDKETGEPLHQAESVILAGKRIFYK